MKNISNNSHKKIKSQIKAILDKYSLDSQLPCIGMIWRQKDNIGNVDIFFVITDDSETSISDNAVAFTCAIADITFAIAALAEEQAKKANNPKRFRRAIMARLKYLHKPGKCFIAD